MRRHGHATGTWEAWSGVELFPGFAAEFKELRERDIQDDSRTRGAEYRGVHHDGSRGRWVLTVGGDRIFYENVTERSAAFFDDIIDSMCWLERD